MMRKLIWGGIALAVFLVAGSYLAATYAVQHPGWALDAARERIRQRMVKPVAQSGGLIVDQISAKESSMVLAPLTRR